MSPDLTPTSPSAPATVDDELERLVSRVAALLAADTPPIQPPSTGGLDALADATNARREAARQRRDLALELVAAALLNQDNPAWDPRDPATSRAASDGTVRRALS